MAHMRKCSMAEAVHLCKHYERNSNIQSYGNSDVDMSKSCENYNLAPERESQTDYIQGKLSEIAHAKRKDLIVMADLIISQPVDLPEEYREPFFQESYYFCVARYGGILGEESVISAYVHMDESTPHMHFAFLPVTENANGELRFCAKEKICRRDLKTLHGDMQKWFDEKGIPARVQNGNTKFDSNGRALSVKELKREEYKNHDRWHEHKHGAKNMQKNYGRW